MDVERTIEFLQNQKAQLAVQQAHLTSTVRELVGTVDKLASTVETRDNLNALIKAVDELIGRRDNGRIQ